MSLRQIVLGEIAYARSGDKGMDANIGVIAFTDEGYAFLTQALSADVVLGFIRSLGPERVTRYELPNLRAFNFMCHGVLAGGASLSLRTDTQGKVLGQLLLELPLMVPEAQWQRLRGDNP
jgi:hypothetical protein